MGLNMFGRGGHAGMEFKWRWTGTGNRWYVVGRAGNRWWDPYNQLRTASQHGWLESIYNNIPNMRKVPDLNQRHPNRLWIRWHINFRNTARKWWGYSYSDNFASRFVGRITILRQGKYRFQLN